MSEQVSKESENTRETKGRRLWLEGGLYPVLALELAPGLTDEQIEAEINLYRRGGLAAIIAANYAARGWNPGPSEARPNDAAPSPLGGLEEVVAEYDAITAKADRWNPEWDFVMRASDWRTIRPAIVMQPPQPPCDNDHVAPGCQGFPDAPTKNARGFSCLEFNDVNGEPCSLQKSSAVDGQFIWLGQGEHRMHVDRALAGMLVPYLQGFAETGELL